MDKNEKIFDPTKGEFVEMEEKKRNNEKNIFISHDSDDSKIALSFCNLLEDSCSAIVRTFCTSRPGNVPKGTKPYDVIMEALNKCTDVICLFTERSKEKPWLLFEAGYGVASKKSVHAIVIGIGMDDVTNRHPFAHFQNTKFEEKDLTELVNHLLEDAIDIKYEKNKKRITKNVRDFIKETTALL